jgi:hypothetical protein
MSPDDRKSDTAAGALAPVLEKFSEAAVQIQQLFQQSPSFQSLCEDYRDCLAAWQHWRQAVSEEAPVLCQSYADLLQELEQEVRDYLEQEETPGSKSGEGKMMGYP